MELLSSCYIFKGLSGAQYRELSKIIKTEQIKKGEFLMREGEKATALFVLEKGAVELLTMVNDDLEIPIAILRNKGDCTGSSSLVAPYQYTLSARCVKDGKIVIVEQKTLEQLMLKDLELGFILMKNMACHLIERLKETRQELKIHFNTILKSMNS